MTHTQRQVELASCHGTAWGNKSQLSSLALNPDHHSGTGSNERRISHKIKDAFTMNLAPTSRPLRCNAIRIAHRVRFYYEKSKLFVGGSYHDRLIKRLCRQICYRPFIASVCGSWWAVSAKGLAKAKGRLRASVQEADIQDTNAASGFCLL